ncbi:hypothetical protein J7E49_22300 [Variovorax paradoxus]|nr:hypothetical protein [Variovorax paradoxus]
MTFAHPLTLTRRRALVALVTSTSVPTAVLAQTERPIRLIVASSAGSTIDVIGRTLQPALTSALGANIVVENIAGAGSIIAMQTLARSVPDGSVIALQTNNMVTAPLLIRTAPYDSTKDFTAIATVGSIPLALVTNASKIRATDAKDFVALLKREAKKLNYGSSGPGTTLHLAVENIADQVGVKLNHLPIRASRRWLPIF